MEIKGTAFLARRRFVVEQCGQIAWDGFIERIKKEIPALAGIVLASTLIPAKDFLKFQERLTTELFRGDTSSYWAMGKQSAKWSLGEGPYHALLGSGNVEQFAPNVQKVWSTFYNDGTATMELAPQHARLIISNLPFWHIYFELVASGFIHGALEMITNKTVHYTREWGGPSKHGCSYLYGPL